MTAKDNKLHPNHTHSPSSDSVSGSVCGGQDTISPPAKVKSLLKPFQILCSGIDTLDLSIDVLWENDLFFQYLGNQKQLAIQDEKETAIIIRNKKEEELLSCVIQPYGAKGHEWVLTGSQYSLTIGNWLEPKSRPSISAKIHSVLLWQFGAKQAVNKLLSVIKQKGGLIKSAKVSRIDLCVDLSFPNKLWAADLANYLVTKASSSAAYSSHKILTGISIGRSNISARLYDKPLEIKQQSKKLWMYAVWGINEEIPEDLKIIRVEFQLRREVLKDLGIDSVFSAFRVCDNIWAYCTKEWLKFRSNPGNHHTQRKTFAWWKTIQDGFLGVQQANPLIRHKSLSPKIKQQFEQSYGFLTSLHALDLEQRDASVSKNISLDDLWETFKKFSVEFGKSDFEVDCDVTDKKARYHISKAKSLEVYHQRGESDFPADSLAIGKIIAEKMENERWKSTSPLKS